jgi:glucosamine-6-phosphate deaminase
MRQHAPHIEIVGDAAAVAERAAAHVVARLRNQPAVTLGLATGATMKPVYTRLVTATRADEVSFRAASSFNLDEFVGVAPQLPRSFHAYMQENLFGHVDMDAGRARIPDGMAGDIAAEAARYEALIAASGGIDLLLLGIGANGHIAFNEPGSDFASRTREVRLDEATRIASARDFPYPAPVPERAITMGIATILDARSILLIATGPAKAAALAAAIEGPIGSACPASALRLHDNVHILCDEAAAAALANRPHNDNRRTA